MPHDYPLHTEVRVPCECCASVQPFTFTAASEPIICAHCRHHLGEEKAQRRDREHVALWSALFAAETAGRGSDAAAARSREAEASEMVASLRLRVGQLSADLLARYEQGDGDAVSALQGDLVKRAERRGELTERKLDRMMAVLWKLAQLHHGDSARALQCSCGLGLAECRVGRALDGERRAIDEWEARNLALLQRGERHALPREHPAVAAG